MDFKKLVLLLLISLPMVSCKGQKLESDMDKYSYAIGQQVGKSIKSAGVEFNDDVFYKSFKAALKGNSDMTDQDIMKAIQTFRMKASQKSKEKAEINLKDGKKFLDDNKSKEGVKVTASGLQYKVIKDGNGKKPKASDKVKVHYKGTLTNGTEFDSSYKRNQPATFPLANVIKGWTEGLQLMPVGSKYMFFIPSNLAYGPMDRPGIPGNSTLIFEVELLSIEK